MPVLPVLRTKISPPRPGPRTLVRPRVSRALKEALKYPLTVVQAGAGFGKSTALIALAEEGLPLIWYQIMEEDQDPLVFLLHLCYATRQALPQIQDLPIGVLDAWEGSSGPLPSYAILDQYLNALSAGLRQPTLLVLDDAHHGAASTEVAHLLDRMIGLAPAELHILLAARPPLSLPNLPRWRSQGKVLNIDHSLLSFSAAEISDLFSQQYQYELTSEEVDLLYQITEGWAIALQLIWQNLRSGGLVSVSGALANQNTSLESLFNVLAREVFEVQPADVQEFLRVSATLREMTVEVCNVLRGANDSAAMLPYLRRQELFVVDQVDNSLRYHHIFRNFLRQQSTPEQHHRWHLQAADYYQSREDFDAALYHLAQVGDADSIAGLLDTYGLQLLTVGRLDTLTAYLDGLPPETLHHHPMLLFLLGELARLRSRFQEALGWYQQAESGWRAHSQVEGVSRALRGQARVYLDTVNPSRAEELLQESLRLSDRMEGRETRARLYELLAENKLNAGKIEEAETLRKQANALRSEGPSDSQLLMRVLLRTGRLREARESLEARAEAERREPVLTPRAHRETLLLLSLVYSFLGMAQAAHAAALEGTRRGSELQSPFIIAVGYQRQGHALMLLPGPDRYAAARQQYEKIFEMSRALSVPRLLVEACWGLVRAYGYQGDLAQAFKFAQQGIEIANQAGDEWIASLVRLSMGASLMLVARYEQAEEWLSRAVLGFQECSDPFGRSAARLWLCLGWYRQKLHPRLAQTLPDLLAICRENGYDFLLTRPSMAGPPDERVFTPLLLLARDSGWEAEYARRVLDQLGLAETLYHPGYQLRVQTLGAFSTSRGERPVPPNAWSRAKARHLFQILLTHRQAPLDRDQIVEYLWPGSEPATAQRNFKVTLNTLYQVLEPERDPGRESAYVMRAGTVYGLRPNADLWLDVEVFESAVSQAEDYLKKIPDQALEAYERALSLYRGEFLPDARYETWSAAEREHLEVMFLRAADQLSELYLQNRRYEEVISVCHTILSYDNCWERAYRHLMLASDALGDRGQVARAYQRCVQTLRDELEVEPSIETVSLYQRLIHARQSSRPSEPR